MCTEIALHLIIFVQIDQSKLVIPYSFGDIVHLFIGQCQCQSAFDVVANAFLSSSDRDWAKVTIAIDNSMAMKEKEAALS